MTPEQKIITLSRIIKDLTIDEEKTKQLIKYHHDNIIQETYITLMRLPKCQNKIIHQ